MYIFLLSSPTFYDFDVLFYIFQFLLVCEILNLSFYSELYPCWVEYPSLQIFLSDYILPVLSVLCCHISFSILIHFLKIAMVNSLKGTVYISMHYILETCHICQITILAKNLKYRELKFC